MSEAALAIAATGLVTSVGLTAAASCAAMHAKLTNPSTTRFIDSEGQWIMAHEVPLERPWRGLERLVRMAAMAVEEALRDVPKVTWRDIPVLLCVAESERPGRAKGLDDHLFDALRQMLGERFATQSTVVPQGRVAVAVALAQARTLVGRHGFGRVLVVAADSLIGWPTLRRYQEQQRLLTPRNSNGFMPGEAAGALLVGSSQSDAQLVCTGLGFSIEPAHIDAELPLRGEGLSRAVKAALAEAGCDLHEMDLRVTDLSGEHYYFKEAALAMSRMLRTRKDEFDLWHPAESTGEVGSVAGITAIALVNAACRKGFAKGSRILAHMANDDGRRAAMVLQYQGAQ